MSCNTDKFTIVRISDNVFKLTIKQTGTTLPMEIVGTDTFKASFVNLETEEVDLELTKDNGITADANLNGLIELIITKDQASSLDSDRADKVDRYYVRPTYKIVLDCDTENNGKFIAVVNEVYVD